MTVLMILAVFAAFVGLDLAVQVVARWFAARRATTAQVRAWRPADGRPPAETGLHERHTWARAVDAVTVAVGLDDLAARLLGRASGLVMPVPGARVRAGTRAFRVRCGTRVADLSSPVDGTVVDVNAALDGEPSLCTSAPWDAGWLFKVRVPDARAAVRRLMRGETATRWAGRERTRLIDRVSERFGVGLAADGGEPVLDLGTHLDRETWELLVHDFLAAGSQRRATEEGR